MKNQSFAHHRYHTVPS